MLKIPNNPPRVTQSRPGVDFDQENSLLLSSNPKNDELQTKNGFQPKNLSIDHEISLENSLVQKASPRFPSRVKNKIDKPLNLAIGSRATFSPLVYYAYSVLAFLLHFLPHCFFVDNLECFCDRKLIFVDFSFFGALFSAKNRFYLQNSSFSG